MEPGQRAGLIFTALSDGTRRALLDLLSHGEQPVQQLAAHFDVTLSAISQHLKVLREAGLVSERRQGRQRLYSFRPEALDEAADWVMKHYERFWKTKLVALGNFLEKQK